MDDIQDRDTVVEELATATGTTKLETQTADPPTRISGMGSQQLMESYHAILRAGAIHYPVVYRFTRELGRGHQGIVFLGLRQGARGCVTRHAIKVFNPAVYSNAKKYWTDMGRIAYQTSKLQLINNPILVAPDIYEETNGIGYLQMANVDGISLRELLNGRYMRNVRARCSDAEWTRFMDVIFSEDRGRLRIQPGVALYIMRQVLRGLETLHEAGFIHSDVKPDNIMIDRLGFVKLIDYGRAVRVNEQVSILLGTPIYMAPETHRRERGVPQSDLFSLGLVGLEMLSGAMPLQTAAASEQDLLNQKIKLNSRITDILPDYVRQNAQFVLLLRRFLEENPSFRYSSAEEAEVGSQGLILVHRQLALAGKDTEYGRELEGFVSKAVESIATERANQGLK